LGGVLYFAGRYDEAQAALNKVVELNPKLQIAHYFRGAILLAQGRPDQALAEMQQEVYEAYRLLGESQVYYKMGRQRESDEALNTLIAKHDKNEAYVIAEAYNYRADTGQALNWLERAFQQRDTTMPNLKIDPLLKNLHQDPRFTELLSKMNLQSSN
jgi:tetratricopeptide (TPR) repeat protein